MIKDNYSHYMWGYRRFKRIPNLGNPYRKDKATLAAFIQSHHATASRPDNGVSGSFTDDTNIDNRK